MRLVIDSKYFGDATAMRQFLQGIITEVNTIDRVGRESSKEPHRFLSDMCPSLLTMRTVCEDMLRELDKRMEDQTYEAGQ